MSYDSILLDLQAVEERASLFNETFPEETLDGLFNFNVQATNKEILAKLAKTILNGQYTTAYLFTYKPIFLEILSYWTTNIPKVDAVRVLEVSSSIITMYPLAMSLIEEFLGRENEHFITILQNTSTQSEDTIFKILLSYYRLLYHNKEVFEMYIKPDLLYKFLSRDENQFSSQIIKFLAIKIISVYLDMGEQATNDMINLNITSEDRLIGVYDNDLNVNYKFLELNEAKRFSNFSKLPEVNECFDINSNHKYFIIEPNDLTEKVVSICGVLVPKVNNINSNDVSPLSFVPTDKTLETLRGLAKQIQKSAPIMLVGKAGAGKTFAINELSKYMGCQKSIVKIHLGEQTDAKLLIGTYTSGEKPGTFEWRSGVLTTAVKEGRWVLIEDIDKAPTEVLSILLSLLEKRQLTIPSRGETIKAANGFQLISTVRINDEDIKRSDDANELNLNLIGMRIWNTIYMEEVNHSDLNRILIQKFPVLSQLVEKLILSYESVRKIYENSRFISLNRGAHARIISVRDLVKLCQRLEVLFNSNNITKPDQLIESTVYDNIFAEAVDCFASSIGELKALEPLIHSIGNSLEIASSRVSLFLDKHVPSLDNTDDHVIIGRTELEKSKMSLLKKSVNTTSFATTNHSLRLMEQIAAAIRMTEPVLLVGETGTGKTTVVQHLSKLLNKTLTVINVSQQTETGDLLGGYKPVNSKTIAIPVQETFELLFASTFSLKKNERFYKILHKCFNKNQWKNVVRLWNEAFKMAESILKQEDPDDTEKQSNKKKRKLGSHEKKILLEQWIQFKKEVKKFEAQSSSIDSSFVFDFVEGSLVKAVRNGEWLLLDEINLASADTLESISDLLSDVASRSILLSEKGDIEAVHAHPNFRIFACMNPATDVGKRDLPSGIRSRFSEIYVNSPDRDITDLLSIIDKYIGKYSSSDEWVGNDIAELYLVAKRLSESNRIVDGSNQRPHFSIRTLTRTLLYVCDIVHIYGLRRSLYDGFCMSFLTLLDQTSAKLLEPLIQKYTLGRLKNVKSILSRAPPAPGSDYIQFKHYWMKTGPEDIKEQAHYIITPFVERNMMNLVRATSSRRFPVLIQGPTSAGKTSMIKYLADTTGHKFVRINNHEHTDLQEYLGTYIADDTGKLVFKEGVLVEALRKGYWIVLDELNLAPTDVLEALNRLLDDNRELFIPETQEVIHPHPDFMLFATQNPPGIYGGRKVLSRAFRNRFLELHFDDIPQDELEIILRERCQIAPTYAKKIVEVYRQLSIERSASRLFEQKNSFATLRDLFRWALRGAVGYEELAANGYMLLAERCRNPQEKIVIKRILEKVMKVTLDMNEYYESLENKNLETEKSVVWTGALRRLAVLVSKCLKNNEPVLLVGETGCGKTTICQILASYLKKDLITLNAHQNTETGDILGAQRPIRNRSELQGKLTQGLQEVLNTNENDLGELLRCYREFDKTDINEQKQSDIKTLKEKLGILFEWNDGPLIHALKTGNFFLLDEISLADDSVLERLNSVLEPERSILLAEKGTTDNFVTASDGFQFFATMNPGGDYGKKELSPALRNRFTEIWVPSMENFDDVRLIVKSTLNEEVQELADAITEFSEWFGKKFGGGNATNGIISLRDILAWVEFINSTYSTGGDIYSTLMHGASMVFVDSLGTNNTAYLAENEDSLNSLKLECIRQLGKFSRKSLTQYVNSSYEVNVGDDSFGIGPFNVPRKHNTGESPSFSLSAPTTSMNLMRVVRALQVHKPILLEGSPGVGKTSLITALADITGNKLTRINLSEQTDLVDLFGSDSPGERSGEFVWRDASFLRAMQQGEWVLLDEMNLASQSVLEGLNACLDHRGEAYIPELDRSFVCHPNFLVFAAQNPQYQGGGRKGLPKSFVNRFSVVYVDILKIKDLITIANHLYPQIQKETSLGLIQVMSTLEDEICKEKKWATSGSPWEFNLRDALRWLKLLSKSSISGEINIFDFVNTIIIQRFRTVPDKERAQKLIESIFGKFTKKENLFKITRSYVQMNTEITSRNPLFTNPSGQHLSTLQCNIPIYETILRCVNNNWPLILVGPTNSGKTDIIHYIASLVGAELHVFSMNNDVDSMDILGGYEQVDLTRKISYVINDLKASLKKSLSLNLGLDNENSEAINIALELFKYISGEIITVPMFNEFQKKFERVYSFLQNDSEFSIFHERVNNLSHIIMQENSVNFEWFDGMLVKAVEQGHWLVLDNANLCSPSVLDRLNSLLETDGSLLINECSQANGEPRQLKPHKNFRLFITMNPKYGELSRAMRNRGIEIFVDDLKDRATTFDCTTLSYEKKDVVKREDELLDDFSNLKLQNCKKPQSLTQFIPTFLSDSNPFAQVDDIISIDSEKLNIESLSTIIPLNRLSDFQEWSENVNNNHSFGKGYMHKSINDYINFLANQNIISKMNEIEGKAEQNVYKILGFDQPDISLQSILPTLNTYILPVLRNISTAVDSSESLYLFTCLGTLMRLSERLQQANHISLNNKIDELNYLELSAAIFNGRHVKNAPRIPLFALLVNLIDFITRWIASGTLFEKKKLYKLLMKLLMILEASLDSTQQRDEARLRVYQGCLLSWSDEAKEAGFDVEEFLGICSNLHNSLQLSSGQSIVPIWESFRKTYPSTLEGWKSWVQLSELCSRFDKVKKEQFSESYDSIRNLTDVISLLSEDILKDNNNSAFKESIRKLDNGVQELEVISSKILNKRKHFFSDDFDNLLRLLFTSNNKSNKQIILDIAPFSSISTEKLIKFNNNNFAYPVIFDHLWAQMNGIYQSFTKSLFTSSYFENIVLKSNLFTSFSGSQIEQTLLDAKTLLSSTIKTSDIILENPVDEYSKLLLNWIEQVIDIHIKTGIKSIDNNYEEYVRNEANETFNKIFITYLKPAMDICTQSTSSLGKAWILFGIALINLFVPNLPVDPAIHDYVHYSTFIRHKDFSQQLVNSWSVIRKIVSGDNRIHTEDLIDIVNDSDAPEKPRVYRPSESVDNLFDEWLAFLESTVSSEQADELVRVMGTWNENASDRHEMFQQNTSNFMHRLESGYTYFSDLNEIFSGYVMSMKFGFDILKYAQSEYNKQLPISSLWSIDATELSNSDKINRSFQLISELIKGSTVENNNPERILIFFLRIIKVHTLHENLILTFNKILRSLHYRWSLRRIRDEQKRQEESSLFKYEDKEDDIETEIRRMFPDYESEDFVSDIHANTKEDISDHYLTIAKLYISIFDNEESTVLSELVKQGASLVDIMVQEAGSVQNFSLNGNQLSGVIVSLNDKIELFRKSGDTKTIDFYKDSSIFEAQNAVKVINSLWLSVDKLLNQWPEHATLIELSRISKEFLEYSADTPLARQLQKIEQIYTLVIEWEKYAASQVSLVENINQMTTLIVSWRRLELQTWNGLFNSEDEHVRKSIGKWWFYLFETLIVSNLNEDADSKPENSNTEIIMSLNSFFSKSTWGEFSDRLRLVESFKKHLVILGLPTSNLIHALDNTINFYKQFEEMILQQIKKGKKSLEKEMNEVILLASWKDVNIDALKQSSRRSHNSLFKIVRKYRALLSTNVLPLIESGLPYTPTIGLDLVSLGLFSTIDYDLESTKKLLLTVPEWHTRSKVLRNVNIVSANMVKYISQINSQTYPDFASFVKEYAHEANRLRDETPNVYKKEIKKLLAALKVQKSKLFSDALKELRRSGLKTRFRDDMHNVQGSATSILANSISFSGGTLKNSDTYYYRVIDLFPRLRNAVSAPADDVPVAGIEKGMAIIENLMFSLITTRQPIYKLSKNYEIVKELRQKLEDLCSSQGSIMQKSLEFNISTITHFVKWLPILIDYCLNALSIINETVSTSKHITFFQQVVLSLREFEERIKNLSALDTSALQLTSEFKNFMKNFIYQMNQNKNETSFFVYDIMLNWINDNQTNDIKNETVAQRIQLQDIDQSLRKLHTSIMLAFQKVMENKIESITVDDDNWLSSFAKSTMTLSKATHSESIIRNINTVMSLLKTNDFTKLESSLVRAMVIFTLPVINHYFDLMRTILEKARNYYISTSRGTYILSNILLNLAKDGFCSPEPPSEQVEDNNLHEGTGLGDGEGAQNNSNDVEQDEDLTEDAQQENNDQKDKDEREEGEDDAVEMEGDMAGKMEDLSDQDENNDEDDEMNEEDEELDEEIDDLNEDDPNAIDDKMWDEKPDDDSKEKNSNKNLDNNGDDDDIQASEENDQDMNNESNPSNEQEKEDEDQNPEESQDKQDKPENDENTDSDDEGEEVGQQDDEVRDEEGQDLDENIPQGETLELPDDMNLDSGEENEEESENDGGQESFEGETEDEEADVDMEHENLENTEENVEVEEDENAEEQEDVDFEDTDLEENIEGNEETEPDQNQEQEQEQGDGTEDENKSEEEELANEQAQAEENGADNDIEGLDGMDNELEEETIDAEAAVQDNSGSKGTGSDTKNDEEQENIGSFGTTQNSHEDQEQEEQNEGTETSREEAKESLEQLGDALKEFHRRRQEINEISERDEEQDETKQKANERPDEFEHVEGANTETDTQALGSANQEQLQSINEDMAIDDDLSDTEQNNEENNPEEDQEMLNEETIKQENISDIEENDEDQQQKEDPIGQGIFGGNQNENDEDEEKEHILDDEDLFRSQEYNDELDDMIETIDKETQEESKIEMPSRAMDESRELWHKSEISTADLVSRLGEQLRLILEPTLATKLKGDYKTGKRLNMKRIIPYIASQFRKDKIWLRRTKPSKRQYQIMIALDNSRSMSESNCVKLAFDSLCLVSKTLTQLESGGLSIVKFGENSKEVHSFDQQFSNDSGSKVFQWFDFQDTKTDVKKLVAESLKIFERGRSITSSDQWQLEIIISDGVCEDHETIQRLVRRAREKKIMLVFVIIDGITSNESIMDMNQVNYIPDKNGNPQLNITKYLDSFPFEFYVVVHEISELPEMLSLILRQYFSDLASS